jgi:hypothetical protein
MAQSKSTKAESLSNHKRKLTLTRSLKLNERLLKEFLDGFETYVRGYRELRGFDPDTEEVSSVWPEDEEEGD